PVQARADGDYLLPHPQPTASAEHQVARDNRRADRSLDVALVENVEFPVRPPRLRVDAGDPVFVASEDQLRRPAPHPYPPPIGWGKGRGGVLVDARRGVAGPTLARHLPADLPRGRVKAEQGTLAVLVIGNDEQVLMDNGGNAEAVPGLE